MMTSNSSSLATAPYWTMVSTRALHSALVCFNSMIWSRPWHCVHTRLKTSLPGPSGRSCAHAGKITSHAAAKKSGNVSRFITRYFRTALGGLAQAFAGEQHQGDPHQVGDQQVDELHPDRRPQKNAEAAGG